jgi:hypothetical protein
VIRAEVGRPLGRTAFRVRLGAVLRSGGLLIVVLALVKGLVWVAVIPPWYGPDELTQFDYVQDLALTGRVPLPTSSGTATDVSPQVNCSMHNNGFMSNGPFYAQVPAIPTIDRCPMPPGSFKVPARPRNEAAAYSPLYYVLCLPPWVLTRAGGVVAQLEAMRLVSVVLGALAVLCTYLAGFWAFAGERRLTMAVGIVVTLQPMISQQTAVVNNDALLILASAAFFWWFFRVVRSPQGLRGAVALGGMAGVAYLAKPDGALLALLVPVALFMELRQNGRLRDGLGTGCRRLLAAAGTCLCLVVAGLLVTLMLGGSVVPFAKPLAGAGHGFRAYLHLVSGGGFHYLGYLLLQGFWGDFGWLVVALPAVVYGVIAAAYLAAAMGVTVGLSRRALRPGVMVGALISCLVITLGLLMVEAVYYRRTGLEVLQGRSFLFMMPPLAVLLVAGLTSLVPVRWRGVGTACVCSAALAVQLISWMVVVQWVYV